MDMDQSGGPPGRQPEQDAVVQTTGEHVPPSRERVLDAAARVFAAQGLDAPMPAVAAEAGVGVGTIYRAFGSKEELVAALAADRMDRFARDAEAALGEADAWQAFADLLSQTADRQAEDHVVTEALAWIYDHPHLREAQQRSATVTRQLMERAKQAGSLRQDFDPADLQMLFAALGAAQQSMPRGSRAWRRLFALLIDGMSTSAPSELGEPALTGDEIALAAKQRRERGGH